MNASELVPRDPFQKLLFTLFLCVFAVSCINPPYLQFMLMQHVPTVLVTILLGIASNRFLISRFSFASIILFLCLHTLGARYLYSYVPYDRWSEAMLGLNISEYFGFVRNHYDRVVHFSYGLLLAVPILEFERRYFQLSVNVSAALAVECILATSAAYELAEWAVAVVFAPEWAESFLGQQGDPFDAHKDMALATTGALVSVAFCLFWRRKNHTA